MDKHSIKRSSVKSADIPSAMQGESSQLPPRSRSDGASTVDLTRDQEDENEEDEEDDELIVVDVINTRNPHRYPPPPLTSPIPPLQPIGKDPRVLVDDEGQWWNIAPRTFPPSDRCVRCAKAKKWCDLGEKGAYPCSRCGERGIRCDNGPPLNNYHITEWNRPGAAAERAAARRRQDDPPVEPNSVQLSELPTTSSIHTHSHQSRPIALQRHRSLPGFSISAPSMPLQYPQMDPPGTYFSPYTTGAISTQPSTGADTDRQNQQCQDDNADISHPSRRKGPRGQVLQKSRFIATSAPAPGPFAPSVPSAGPRLETSSHSEITPYGILGKGRPRSENYKEYQEHGVQDKSNMGKVKRRGSKRNIEATTAIKSIKETKASLSKKARGEKTVIIISDDDDDYDEDKDNGVEDEDEEDNGLDYPPRGNRASARVLRSTRSASSIPALTGNHKPINSFLQSSRKPATTGLRPSGSQQLSNSYLPQSGNSTTPGLRPSGSQQLPNAYLPQSGNSTTPGLRPSGSQQLLNAYLPQPSRPPGSLPYFTRPIKEIKDAYENAYDALDEHFHDLEELSYNRPPSRAWGLQRAEMKGRRSAMRFMIKELKKLAMEYPTHTSDPNDPHRNNPIVVLLNNHMGEWYYSTHTAGIVNSLKSRIETLRAEKIPLDTAIAKADAEERTEFDGRRFKIQRAELMARLTAKMYVLREMDAIVVWEQREKEKQEAQAEHDRVEREAGLEAARGVNRGVDREGEPEGEPEGKLEGISDETPEEDLYGEHEE